MNNDLPGEKLLKLDRVDIRILHELQKNGRITNVELAELVYLSPSPCLSRVKKLQKSGYITGYSAQIDIAKLGSTVTVFTEVTLKSHHLHDFDNFQRAAKKIARTNAPDTVFATWPSARAAKATPEKIAA